jgi:hypothetical protein
MFFITSLIPPQTKLYQTERSLSESWRVRSKTRSGFDVAFVTALQPWEKLQSANRMATPLGISPEAHFKAPDLITDGGQ